MFDNQASIFRQNVLINTNVFESVRTRGVDGLLYVGTACSFPAHLQASADARPLREEDLYPAAPESAYGWSKLIGQYEADLLAEETGIPVATLILHNVYGTPTDYTAPTGQVVPSLVRKAIRYPQEPFVVWGSGSQGRAFVHVDDVVNALLSAAMTDGLGRGVIQIGPDICTTIRELAETIVAILGDMRPSSTRRLLRGRGAERPTLEGARRVSRGSHVTLSGISISIRGCAASSERKPPRTSTVPSGTRWSPPRDRSAEALRPVVGAAGRVPGDLRPADDASDQHERPGFAEAFDPPGPVVGDGSYRRAGFEWLADLFRPYFPGREYLALDLREGNGVDRIEVRLTMTFDDASVGTLLAFRRSSTCPIPHAAVSEAARVLRPDGLFTLTRPSI